MITIDDCIKSIKENNPALNVVSCKDYGDFYLFTAYVDPTDIDPFYLIHKKSGAVSPYTIAMDPDRYYRAKELLK